MASSQTVAGEDIGEGNGKKAEPYGKHQEICHPGPRGVDTAQASARP
jgi:hypothetical protein